MSNYFLNKVSEQYTSKIYRTCFFTALVIFLLLLIFRSLLVFTYNPEIGGIDNNFVYAVIRSMAGYDIYPDPTQFPYAVNLYTPLYFNLCSFIGNFLNLNIDEPINIYRLCRFVSLISDLITCLLFFRILIKTTPLKKEIAFLITALFACILCFLGYTFCRSDSLFLSFYAATFYILLTSSIKKSLAKNIFLAVLTTACIYSKQNGIILPALIAVWIFLNHSLKRSVSYLFIFILFFTGLFLLYNYSLGYSYFTSHTIDALKNRIDLHWFYAAIFKRFADSLIIVPLYISLYISFIYLNKGSGKEKSLGIVFLLQILFSLGASLKWGSTAGYFNESFFIGLILIANYISATDRTAQSFSKKLAAWYLPLFTLFSSFVCVNGYLFYIQKQKMKKEVYNDQVVIRNYLAPKLESTYVFNLGDQNGDFFKTLFYKQAVVPNYDAVSCCTLPDKTFDYSNLLTDLRSGKIAWLIMPEKTITLEQWGVSLDHFKKDTIIKGHIIYKFQQ